MPTFTDSLQIVDLELFDAAFAIAPGDEDEVKRRFMTLFAHETGMRCGGSAEVCLVSNARGERFALKRLHVASPLPNTSQESPQPPGPGAAQPMRKELRHSVGSSGTPGHSPTPDYVTQGHVAAFYEEYRIHLAVSSLRGFPRLYGFGLSGGQPVIIMEWVKGITLREAVRERGKTTDGPVPLTVVARLGLEVLALLRRAGELSERFVHRDLSPRNIMLRTDRFTAEEQLATGDFDLCLIDFGSSALTAADARQATFTARTGVWRLGTPAYAPPEMLTADVVLPEEVRHSPAIDVYALCSVLFELYAGETPFAIGSPDERSPYRIKTEDVPRNLTLREPDGGALAEAIRAGISPQPQDRPSPKDLATALANWLALPDEAPAGSWRGTRPAERGFWQPDYARRLVTRRRLISGCIVGASALVSGALAAGKLLSRRGPSLDENRYERADAPYAGEPLFRAYDGRRSGWVLCTADGEIVCNPMSSRPCGPLREGLVALFDDLSGRYGFVTPTGSSDSYAWAILPRYAQVDSFSGGHAAAQDAETGLWGYIDMTGTWAVQPKFAEAAAFSCDVAAARAGGHRGLWGALDEAGSWVIEPQFLSLGQRADDGCAVAQDADGRWGFVDEMGSWTTETRFLQLRRYVGGLAPALDDAMRLWGFVDARGAWVVAPAYLDARPFSPLEGGGDFLASVKDATSQLWHFVEPDGTPHTKPNLWKLGDLTDGLAPAQARADDDTLTFDDSESDARAEGVGMRYGYVDAQGAWQMRQLTDLTDTAIDPAEI